MQGNGTQTSPFIVRTKEDFAEFIAMTNTAGLYFRQVAPIDLSGLNYATMQRFDGFYDGGLHELRNPSKPLFALLTGTVSGLKIINASYESNASAVGVGLLANVAEGATLFRVGVYNSKLSVPNAIYVGGLVGVARSNTKIKECLARNTEVLGNTYVGGLVGRLEVPYEVRDNYFVGTVQTTFHAPVCGGFAGAIQLSQSLSSAPPLVNCFTHVKLVTIANEDTGDLVGRVEYGWKFRNFRTTKVPKITLKLGNRTTQRRFRIALQKLGNKKEVQLRTELHGN